MKFLDVGKTIDVGRMVPACECKLANFCKYVVRLQLRQTRAARRVNDNRILNPGNFPFITADDGDLQLTTLLTRYGLGFPAAAFSWNSYRCLFGAYWQTLLLAKQSRMYALIFLIFHSLGKALSSHQLAVG